MNAIQILGLTRDYGGRRVGTAEELKALTGCASFEDAFVALAGEGAAS